MDLPRPPRWKRILKRSFLLGALVFVAALALGVVMQQRHDAVCHSQHPPPGSFVTVDDHRIHYRLRGEGDFTFVLEAGLGDYSGSWQPLEDGLAKLGRVFAYDRAGLGWSESTRGPRTPAAIAAELHAVLTAARIPKPWILVGHSSGGISQVLFAMDHPDEVAGLLLIDPSHKDQFRRLPAPPAVLRWLLPQVTRLAPAGLPQLLFRSKDPVQMLSLHVRTSGAELRALLDAGAAWQDRPTSLGNLPLFLLTADGSEVLPGKTEEERRAAWTIWKTMHDELLAASTSEIRRHDVVPGSGHHIHRTHPDVVITAAREFLQRIEAGRDQGVRQRKLARPSEPTVH
jgi:pimeloyl-ACP methyl ester carboxylesterase